VPPAEDTRPEVLLRGITSMHGSNYAIVRVTEPNGSARTLLLAAGESSGEIEVPGIDVETHKVRLLNQGIEQTLSYDISALQAGTDGEYWIRTNDVPEQALLVQPMVPWQTNAFTGATEVARQPAEINRHGELPGLQKVLSNGSSKERKDALGLIARERLALIMDDEFIRAYARCAEDEDRAVRSEVARQVGERWIWSAERQHPEAIELMLRLSRDRDREVRHSAVYFGLSTIPRKDERVLRRLLELALADQEMNDEGSFGRIAWGVRDQREQAARILDEYLERAEHAEAAHRVYERITGRRPPRGRPIPADRARLERELEARYQAALQITFFTQADAALKAVAVDAAKAGIPATAIKALKKITFFSVGDSAAVEVTTHLVKAKLYADAFEAAKGITAFSRKDEALRIVAQAAAAGCDHAIASKAVKGMTSFSARDEAAAETARELAKKGYTAEAIELAKTITAFNKRDALLRELAEGRSTRTNSR